MLGTVLSRVHNIVDRFKQENGNLKKGGISMMIRNVFCVLQIYL